MGDETESRASNTAIEFDTVLLKHESLDAAYIIPPFDPEALFGAKRIKVKATFDGFEYRGSIVRMGGSYMLGVTKQVRSAIGKGFGETVHVSIEKDTDERTVEMPPELNDALSSNPSSFALFSALSYSRRKEFANWVACGAKEETRYARAQKAAVMISKGESLK